MAWCAATSRETQTNTSAPIYPHATVVVIAAAPSRLRYNTGPPAASTDARRNGKMPPKKSPKTGSSLDSTWRRWTAAKTSPSALIPAAPTGRGNENGASDASINAVYGHKLYKHLDSFIGRYGRPDRRSNPLRATNTGNEQTGRNARC